MSEDDLALAISKTFTGFDDAVKLLDQIPQSAKTKTEALIKLVSEEDIFSEDKQQEFLSLIIELSEEIGHAYHTVLIIELARENIKSSVPPPSMPQMPSASQGQQQALSPTVAVSTAPSKGGGFWDAVAARRYAKAWEKIFVKDKDTKQETPQISTSREVTDVLEFGRQLTPEFNRVFDYYSRALDHLSFFNDEDTVQRFHSKLVLHLTKLVGIIRSFSKTITEYRKDLLADRKVVVAQGIIGLKMAEYQSLGGMRISDFYRQLRESSAPTQADKR